jgi:hypothetical protein
VLEVWLVRFGEISRSRRRLMHPAQSMPFKGHLSSRCLVKQIYDRKYDPAKGLMMILTRLRRHAQIVDKLVPVLTGQPDNKAFINDLEITVRSIVVNNNGPD